MEVTLFTEHAVYTVTLTSKFLSLEIGPADSEELRCFFCFVFFYVVCVALNAVLKIIQPCCQKVTTGVLCIRS